MTVKELKDMFKNVDNEAEIKIKLHVYDSNQIEIDETYEDIYRVIVATDVYDKNQSLDLECNYFLKEKESK